MKISVLLLGGVTIMAFTSLSAQPPITIGTINDLQKIGFDPAYPLDADYIISQDIDASSTVSWNSGRGFNPIGETASLTQPLPFEGSLDGQGHTISGLIIYRPEAPAVYTGLFAAVGEAGRIENLRLTECQVTGQIGVGALVARNAGTITGCHVSGSIYGTDQLYMGGSVGGLVGVNLGTGMISACSTEGIVHSTGDEGGAGGLVGVNSGAIDNCHSSAAVEAALRAGGLVGIHKLPSDTPPTGVALTPGTITNSYATGNICGEGVLGGLAGQNGVDDTTAQPIIANCHATGTVTASEGFFAEELGGLIGNNKGSVTGCYAEGAITGLSDLGGLIGLNCVGADLSQCYATGDVSGASMAGGFVGRFLGGSITQCFATGNITTTNGSAGGFAGELSNGTVSQCFAEGSVTAENAIAGFATVFENITLEQCYSIGQVNETNPDPHMPGAGGLVIGPPNSVVASFWDTESSGMTYSIGGEGLTTAAMQQQDTYTAAGWDFETVWGITEGVSYPCLRWSSPYCGLETTLSVRVSGGTVVKRKPGAAQTFRAVVSDAVGQVAYQWYFENADKGLISGANEAEYHIPYVSTTDAGWYHCVASDEQTTAASAPVQLMVVDDLPAANAIVFLAAGVLLAALGASYTRRSRI